MGTSHGIRRVEPEKGDDQISVDRLGDVLVLHLSGQFLGGEETERLRSVLLDLDRSVKRVVLDLRDVSFVNSSFLSSLIAEHTSHRRHGRTILLACVRPTVRKILELTHISAIIPVYDDVEAASRSSE